MLQISYMMPFVLLLVSSLVPRQLLDPVIISLCSRLSKGIIYP